MANRMYSLLKLNITTLLVITMALVIFPAKIEALSLINPISGSIVKSEKLSVNGRVEEPGKVIVDIGMRGDLNLKLASKSLELAQSQNFVIDFFPEDLKANPGEVLNLWLIAQFLPVDKSRIPPFPVFLEFTWETTGTLTQLPTITASVSPASIIRGATATLSWSSTNATSVSITPDIGSVAISGTRTASPTATTTYIFTATGPGGTAEARVTLTVTEPPPPPPLLYRTVELRIGSTIYKVDGVINTMDAAPYIEEGRTMVPVRFLAEGLGGTVLWDNATRTVTVKFTKPILEIKLIIGNPTATVNGKKVQIDINNNKVVPIIKNNRTFVPLRFLVEQITGSSIDWIPPDTVIMKLPK